MSEDKCECGLQGAARGRHCRHCDPQAEIDRLNDCIVDDQEVIGELEDQAKELESLVKSSFWDGYHRSVHNEGYDDAWRYSGTKKELEKATGNECENNDW